MPWKDHMTAEATSASVHRSSSAAAVIRRRRASPMLKPLQAMATAMKTTVRQSCRTRATRPTAHSAVIATQAS